MRYRKFSPALFLALASWPVAAAPGDTLFGLVKDTSFSALSETSNGVTSRSQENADFVIPPASGSAETLIDPNTQGVGEFSSALAESNGNVEVGVRAFNNRGNDSRALAEAGVTFKISSDLPLSSPIGFEFNIPGGVVQLTRGVFSTRDQLPFAGVEIFVEYSRFDECSSDENCGTLLFDEFISVQGSPSGLVFDTGGGALKTRPLLDGLGRQSGLIIDPFVGNVVLPLGEQTFNLTYLLRATGFTPFVETFYSAAIGDPLNASLSGSTRFFEAPSVSLPPPPPPTSVPEPSSLTLGLLGLAALALVARRREVA